MRGHSDLENSGPGQISSASGLHVAVCMVHMCPLLPLKGGRADFSLSEVCLLSGIAFPRWVQPDPCLFV